MIPAVSDITIQRGSTAPINIRLKSKDLATGVMSLMDLGGADVALSITWFGGTLEKTIGTGGLAHDATTGDITWTPSPSESLSIPRGRLAQYVYAVSFDGGVQDDPYLRGYLIGEGDG